MNITILGAGFAALAAIAKIKKTAPEANIQVIAPSEFFVYYPSLNWILSGKRKGSDITFDLTDYFKKYGVEFVKAHVTGVSEQGRVVMTEAGNFNNDGLIVATGCQFVKNLSGIEHAHVMCQGIQSAEATKEKLESLNEGTIVIGCDENPNELSAKRGAGTVLEFVLGIDSLLRQQGRRDKFKLVFLSTEQDPIAQLGTKASTTIQGVLKKQNIEMRFGETIKAFEANKVVLADSEINADLILFQPYMTGADWLDNTDFPRSPAGLIQADEHAQVVGLENTYVAGEVGSYPGPEWQPKLGVNAGIQAKAAVHNLVNELNKSGAEKQQINVKLIYMIDSLTHGIFIKRTENREKVIPPLRLFHFVKQFIEWIHLKKFK